MRRIGLALLLLSCGPSFAIAENTPRVVKGTAREDRGSVLLARLGQLDINDMNAVAGFFRARLTLLNQSEFFRFWQADIPESDLAPRLHVEYYQRIADSATGNNALVLTLSEASMPMQVVRAAYPDLRWVGGARGHFPDPEFGYVADGPNNRFRFGFVDADRPYVHTVRIEPISSASSLKR